MFAAGKGSGYINKDANFGSTALLIHADGTNSTNNKTFLDSGPDILTITANGTPGQGSYSPYSNSSWSNYFNSTNSDYLAISDNAAFSIGTGDFHLECWFWLTGDGATYSFISKGISSTTTGFSWRINSSNSGIELAIGSTNYNRGGYYSQTGSGFFNSYGNGTSKWVHIVAGRNSGSLYMGINGEVLQLGTDTTNLTTAANLYIGGGRDNGASAPVAGNFFDGYISDVRIIKGTNPYGITASTTGIGAYTVPKLPLTAVTNTSLLTCQSNRFVDKSASPLTITVGVAPQIYAFGPVATDSYYKSTVNGGSTYFNGSTDYLTATLASFGTGDFTVEGWFNPTTTGTNLPLMSFGDLNASGSLGIFYTSASATVVRFSLSGSDTTTAATIPIKRWTHVAVVRQSSVINIYFNGVAQTKSGSTNPGTNHTGTAFYLGYSGPTVGTYFPGYVSDLRVVNGTAVYTANFTPPTAPLTAIANTKLLLSSTNAKIFDQTGRNNLTTIGSAAISTSKSKYGTGSVSLGSGNYLIIDPQQFNFLSNTDFTLEFWFNLNTNDIQTSWAMGNGITVNQFALGLTFQTVLWYEGSSQFTANIGSGGFTTGVWHHLAVVRSGGYTSLTKIYFNGTQYGTTRSSTPPYVYSSTTNITIGAYGGSNSFDGYMDDIRISRYGRYTANFTPPSGPLADQ